MTSCKPGLQEVCFCKRFAKGIKKNVFIQQKTFCKVAKGTLFFCKGYGIYIPFARGIYNTEIAKG